MPDLGLTPGVLLDEAHLTGDLSGADGTDARLLECTVTEADLSEVKLGGARLTDTRFHAVRGTGLAAANSVWLDCSLDGARLGAVALYGAQWRRVHVIRSKIEFLNARGARLREVIFEDCQLVEPDFAAAVMEDVTFDGCRLVSPEFSQAQLNRVDLSGADLVSPHGIPSLRGASISRLQLIDLAPALAAQLGITVKD
jgi:uncharacterized protein YjbI with pentapeptide repeats